MCQPNNGENGEMEYGQSTASQYLSILQRARLIESERIGEYTHYTKNEEKNTSHKESSKTE